MSISLKRVYESSEKSDGVRILVDRIWPRGVTKEKANVDLWIKEVTPSTELRKWFGHDPEKWTHFQKQYREELKDNQALSDIRAMSREQHVTLIYAAKDEQHTHAIVLKRVLEEGV